jgi:NAD(P)-dependent dehydrogenase (short-subunit alcohol dehydrogenase family)
MTVSFAFTFGPKVRVNCIMPGGFLTDIARAWDPEDTQQRLGQISLGRFGDPDEVVGTAVYLASDAASYTTGAVIAVDGGLTY